MSAARQDFRVDVMRHNCVGVPEGLEEPEWMRAAATRLASKFNCSEITTATDEM
jgi:hypothetical protein